MKKRICALILMLVFMLMACSSPQREAKGTLAQRGITYNEMTFFANVIEGKAKIVKLFLQAGIPPDVKNADKTALMEAARRVYIDIAWDLINAGADVNAKDNYGTTPLIFAAISGSTEIMQALIDKNADVNAKDRNGRTALIEVLSTENDHPPENAGSCPLQQRQFQMVCVSSRIHALWCAGNLELGSAFEQHIACPNVNVSITCHDVTHFFSRLGEALKFMAGYGP